MPINKGDVFSGLEKIRRAVKAMPTQIGAEAENFFRSNFDVQGWQGSNGLEPWAKRKDAAITRKILIGKGTGHLRKGLRKYVRGAVIGVKVTGVATAYADLHNFGGTVNIPITSKLKKWAWAMYYKTGKPMYKAMALSSGTIKVTMPKRQFIGNSRQLDDKIQALIERELKKAVS